jgi:hypothetical protein
MASDELSCGVLVRNDQWWSWWISLRDDGFQATEAGNTTEIMRHGAAGFGRGWRSGGWI